MYFIEPYESVKCETVVECCSSDRRPDRGGRGARGRGGGMASKYYSGDSADVSRLLDSLLRGYDKRLRPNYNGQLHQNVVFKLENVLVQCRHIVRPSA